MSFEEILAHCWQLWYSGAAHRQHAFHMPAVSNVQMHNGQYFPDSRTMVLRQAHSDSAQLVFHTDTRSPKVNAFGKHPQAHVLAYSPANKVQIRATGLAQIHTQGDMVEQAWAQSTLFAKRCYLSSLGSGYVIDAAHSGLPADLEGIEPDEARAQAGRQNFALLSIHLNQMDYLSLAHTGHRRALLSLHNHRWGGQWLCP
jgi:pyridoxamine 5'-phosphate oxidase